MSKKCIICNDPAEYKIKDSLDYYCADCAIENFSDISVLVKVEEEAQRLKQFLKKKIDFNKLNEQANIGKETDEKTVEIKQGLDLTEEEEGDEISKKENEEFEEE